jgi:membrane protease YdiL (CAAX protease family)
VAAIVTACVTAAARFLPDKAVATTIGFIFLGATGVFVWRKDDAKVERYGLALGGLVVPHAPWRRTLHDGARAAAWAGAFAAITFVPFYFGFRLYWRWRGLVPSDAVFSWPSHPTTLAANIAGQLLMIALPEEAFYRGYLQTRLDEALPRRVRIAGAEVGYSLLVTSALFAVGHVATIPSAQRLAVFFPSLAFGWLRARTRGVGASIGYHALCNVFSELLGHGYGLY